jgi:hypothetical protein
MVAGLLPSVLRRMGDDWFIGAFSSPGQPLKQFRKLTSAVAARMPELRADTEQLLATAEQLLAQRHRVVHSAMMGELDPGSRLYEAWHAKTDVMWSVVPVDLNSLARDLAQCAREVDALAPHRRSAPTGTAGPFSTSQADCLRELRSCDQRRVEWLVLLCVTKGRRAGGSDRCVQRLGRPDTPATRPRRDEVY